MEPEEWWREAACRDAPPEVMHVAGAAQNRVVRRFCQDCPVRFECLVEALDGDIEWGVWGGLTERQRRALKKRNPHVKRWRPIVMRAA